MFYKTIFAAGLVLTATQPALSQGLGGASVSGEFRQYDDSNFDETSFSLEGGADVQLGQGFGLGANISVSETAFFSFIDDEPEDMINVTGHAMYMISPGAALGVYASQDTFDLFDSTNYGFEVGSWSREGRFELYFGLAETSDDFFGDDELGVAGLSFELNVSNDISLGVSYDAFTIEDGVLVEDTGEIEDFTISDTALIARYNSDFGASFYAKIGQISGSATSDDAFYTTVNEIEYFGFGAEYVFGGTDRNIFSARTLAGFGS